MPSKTKTSKSTLHPKRHGLHHKRGKDYKQVYWPFIPLLSFVLLIGLSIGLLHSSHPRRVLSYATEMSQSSLIDATNAKRAENQKSALRISEKLNQAAQAKAQDMVARDYWSHQTPDGQDPWVFVNKAGYEYIKAGENLAYGFSTSTEAVAGWMNSQSHRENLLDSAFVEVGFGFANSSDYQGSGQETIVVALYGQPKNESFLYAPSSVDTENPTSLAAIQPAKAVARVDALTDGKAPWALFIVGLTSGSAVTGLLVSHGLRLKKLLSKSEKFFVTHPLFDLGLVGIAILGIELTRTVGFIH